MISSSERHHQTLLTDRNLLVVVRESQSYIIPIIPRLAPKVLVLGEHHVMNDLLSYENAWAAYAKAWQDRLDQREKKCQEGTLRQALSVSCQATNSTARPSAKRKSTLQPTRKALDLSPSPFSLSLSLEAGINQGSTGSPSIGVNPDQELELAVPFIVLELEEEEKGKEMALNLRVNFKEMQRKRLSESLLVVFPPTKRSCLEVSPKISDLDTSMAQVPLFDVARTG